MKCHGPSFKAGGRLRRGAQTSKTFTQSEEVPAWWRQHQCLPAVFRTKHDDREKGQAWPAHSAWPGSGQGRAPGIGGGGVQEPCPLAARALEPSLCSTIPVSGAGTRGRLAWSSYMVPPEQKVTGVPQEL